MTELEFTDDTRQAWRDGLADARAEHERREAEREARRAERDRVDVWVAMGLVKRWRVVSNTTTWGEWDELGDANRFLQLLVDGNPQLRRLS